MDQDFLSRLTDTTIGPDRQHSIVVIKVPPAASVADQDFAPMP